jgi:membrane protein implicated in regulation of membrane protease activity
MPVSPDTAELIGFQKAEFGQCARLRSHVLRWQAAAMMAAALSAMIQIPAALYVLSILTLIAAVAAFFCNHSLSTSREHAEKLRRATMLIGGLGLNLSGAELLELRQGGSASIETAQQLADSNYFVSDKPLGASRLVDMLEESAIWTANLSRYAARETWIFFLAMASVLICALLAAILFSSPTEWQIGARIVVAILIGLFTVDFLGAALAYNDANRVALRVVDRLQKYKETSPTTEQILVIFGDYNYAVQNMPPFPKGLYHRYEKRLNEEHRMFLTGPNQ